MTSSPKKMIILGAGATLGSSVTRPDLPPPLLKDLPRITTESFLSLNRSKDGPAFDIEFHKLLRLTDTESDIEQYLTILHVLGLISRVINPKVIFLEEKQIAVLLSGKELEAAFNDSNLSKKARKVVEYFRDHKGISLMNYPRNFETLFQNSLREYMFNALENCFCKYHERLFSILESGDVVVNFNYDEIADFTLFETGRLCVDSFESLPFAKISFPRTTPGSCTAIRYLKLHGSFNWWTGINIRDVYYDLLSEATDRGPIGETFFPIILPTWTKKIIYDQYEIYRAHVSLFQSLLSESTELIIAGKSFMNADAELNHDIHRSCSTRQRSLTVIDPNTVDRNFVSYHEKLFNAVNVNLYSSLSDYFYHKMPA